jgi:hypothetical protein
MKKEREKRKYPRDSVNARKPRTRVKNVRSPERIDLSGLITFWRFRKKYVSDIRIPLRLVKVQETLQI